MKYIYTCTSKAHADEDDQHDHTWVSLDPDNEGWLEVNATADQIGPEDYEQIVKLFAPQETTRKGKRVFFTPLRIATRGLRLFCKETVFHEPSAVNA